MTDLFHPRNCFHPQVPPGDPTAEAMDSAEAMRVSGEEELKAAEKAEESFFKLAEEFESNFKFHAVEMKIHRFPAVLQDLGDRYIVPMVVAIGPYHHDVPRLREMETVKHAAAAHFIQGVGRSYEQIRETFLPVTAVARRLYADDIVVAAGIEDADDFPLMMFRDACFLLQYMLSLSTSPRFNEDVKGELLQRFFVSNQACIENDIMLLENQLPWKVVQTLMRFWPVDVEEFTEEFIVKMGRKFHIPNHKGKDVERKHLLSSPKYSPPHLLGLLRLHKIAVPEQADRVAQTMKTSVPIGASQLRINGIKLTASESAAFSDVKITKGFFFDKFSLAPLSLDGTTACWLVNMAAFEVWTAASFSEVSNKTSVSSYLALLAMLTDREEDVHKLRTNHLLRTELTDKQTLDFFDNIVEQISPGRGYIKILEDIEKCKSRRKYLIIAAKFVCRNSKTIATVLSIIGILVGIFKTLYSLKQHQQ